MKRLVLLAVATGLAVYGQKYLEQRVYLTDAFLFFVAAAVLAAIVYWRFRLEGDAAGSRLPGPMPDTGFRAGLSTHWPAKMLIATGLILSVVAFSRFRANDSNQGLVFWLLGLVLFTVAWWVAEKGAGLDEVRRGATGLVRRLKGTRLRGLPARSRIVVWLSSPAGREALLFALAMAVGIFFRLYRIDSVPPGLNNDSAWNGLYAIKLLRGEPYTAYTVEGGAGRETLHFYLTAGLILLFGPTPLAVKLSAVVAGILALAAFYFLVRRLFSTREAVLATLLLGLSGWHLTFSKVGWRAVEVPLMQAIAFYFLWVALGSGRKIHYALAGIGLGLSLNTYDAGRVTPIITAAFLLYKTVAERSFLRRSYQGLVVYAVSTAIMLIPLEVYALDHWVEFTNRTDQLAIWREVERVGSLQPLWDNLKTAVLIFNYRANGNDFFIENPLLDLPMAAFFALGIVYNLLRWREPKHLLLLIWFFLGLVPGVLAIPNGNRCIATMLPTFVFAGLFLSVGWAALTKVVGRQRQWGVVSIFVLLFLGIAYQTYHDYIGPERRSVYGLFEDGVVVGRLVNEIRDDYQNLYLGDRYYVGNTIRYVAYRWGEDPFARPYQRFDPSAVLLFDRVAKEGSLAFVLEATGRDREVLKLLEARYPGSRLQEVLDPERPGLPVALVLYVPQGSQGEKRVFTNGLLATYYEGTEWSGKPVYQFVDPLIAINRDLALPSFSVRWEGEIEIAQPGTYTFAILSDDGSFLFIDGQMVVDNGGYHAAQRRDGQIALSQGRHKIEIRYFNEGSGMAMEVFWAGPGVGTQMLPAQVLYPAAASEAMVAMPSPVVEKPRPTLIMEPVKKAPVGFNFVLEWGGFGTEEGQFQEPRDVAADSQGNIYVVDSANFRIQKFDAEGHFLAQWGERGEGDGQFMEPLAVAVDSEGRVLVLDSYTGWVQRFDAEGRFLDKIAGPGAAFFHPRDLAVDREGYTYVADTGFARVVKFGPGGEKVGEFGGRGSGPGEMLGPVGLDFDAMGNLFLADVENQRVQRLDSDGRYQGEWGVPVEPASVDGPHLAVGKDGRVYITDPRGHRILVYDMDGQVVGGWGEEGDGPGQFRMPVSIVADGRGYIYVADTLNHRIQKFKEWQ